MGSKLWSRCARPRSAGSGRDRTLRVPRRQLLTPLALAAALALSPVALAQPLGVGRLPQQIVTKTTELSQDEARQLREFVARHAGQLASADTQARSSARQALSQPLRDSQISVQFRLAYSRALVPELERAYEAGDRGAKIAILLLAGEIATDQSVRLAQANIANSDPILRYQAAFGIGLTLNAVATRSPAITRQSVDRLIDTLSSRIAAEQDPWVLDRVVRSLSAAIGITAQGFEGAKSRTVALLADGVAQRVASLAADGNQSEQAGLNRPILLVLLRAAEIVQQSLTRPPISDTEAVAGARLGGELLALVSRVMASGSASPEQRQLLIQIASTGENAIFFARSNHSRRRASPSPTTAGQALANRDNQGFMRQIEPLIGQGGALTSEPFNLGPFRTSN